MSHVVVQCYGLAATNLAAATVSASTGGVPALPRLDAADAEDPTRLLKTLERQRQDIRTILGTLATTPFAETVLYEDLSVTSATAFTLAHGFGRPARYMIVSRSAACELYTSATSNDAIALIPTATATISVLVF
jgi:hypothetical protein